MSRKRPTVADIRAMKGRHQFTMLRVETLKELASRACTKLTLM
jgi:3-methyl-2-oxobutanoate hydroxymethyltransferase